MSPTGPELTSDPILYLIVLPSFLPSDWHLFVWVQSILGKAKLNCPADEAFKSEYVIFKAIEAVETRQLVTIQVSSV